MSNQESATPQIAWLTALPRLEDLPQVDAGGYDPARVRECASRSTRSVDMRCSRRPRPRVLQAAGKTGTSTPRDMPCAWTRCTSSAPPQSSPTRSSATRNAIVDAARASAEASRTRGTAPIEHAEPAVAPSIAAAPPLEPAPVVEPKPTVPAPPLSPPDDPVATEPELTVEERARQRVDAAARAAGLTPTKRRSSPGAEQPDDATDSDVPAGSESPASGSSAAEDDAPSPPPDSPPPADEQGDGTR